MIPIVDQNDNIIGYKDRPDDDDIYRVTALWIVDGKRVLIARRGYNKKRHPGQWGPSVAGTIEKGEEYDENIVKELKEELGVFGKPTFLVKNFHDGEVKFFANWYYLKYNGEKIEPNEEVAETKWINHLQLIEEIKNNPDEYLKFMDRWVKQLVEFGIIDE